MVSSEILLSYLDWKISFALHTDALDKHLGAVISHNDKTTEFLSKRSIKPQRN